MSSSLAKCYLFRSVSKNKKARFNFLPLSEMRHSYLRCPTLNRCTMLAYYCWPFSKWRSLYSHMPFFEYPTSNNWVSYSECPTRYKCSLLGIDTIRNPALYKSPNLVGAASMESLLVRAPTRVRFLYEVRLRIVSIQSRTHLYRVGHSE